MAPNIFTPKLLKNFFPLPFYVTSLIVTAWKVSKYRFISGPVFSCIRTEYRDLRSKPPYSVRIQENADQKSLNIWTLFKQWVINPMHFSFRWFSIIPSQISLNLGFEFLWFQRKWKNTWRMCLLDVLAFYFCWCQHKQLKGNYFQHYFYKSIKFKPLQGKLFS